VGLRATGCTYGEAVNQELDICHTALRLVGQILDIIKCVIVRLSIEDKKRTYAAEVHQGSR
jgi:hypothetical protein